MRFSIFQLAMEVLFYRVFTLLKLIELLDGVKIKVSAAHKSKQILPAYEQGELRCRFEGEPVSITWRKVGLRGLPNRMIPRKDKLDIQDVDMRDSGMYKCKAYDGFFTAEAEINVTINGKSEIGRYKYLNSLGMPKIVKAFFKFVSRSLS